MLKTNQHLHPESPLGFPFSQSPLPFAHLPFPSPFSSIHGKNERILQRECLESKAWLFLVTNLMAAMSFLDHSF